MDKEQEHEIYGGEIPEEEGELEPDEEMTAADDQDPRSSKEVSTSSKTLDF